MINSSLCYEYVKCEENKKYYLLCEKCPKNNHGCYPLKTWAELEDSLWGIFLNEELEEIIQIHSNRIFCDDIYEEIETVISPLPVAVYFSNTGKSWIDDEYLYAFNNEEEFNKYRESLKDS